MTDASQTQHSAQPLNIRVAQLERRYAVVLAINWLAVIFPGAVMVLYAQSRGLSLAGIDRCLRRGVRRHGGAAGPAHR